MDVRKQLRQILDETGWSQDSLAFFLDVAPKTLSSWITGKAEPRNKHLDKIQSLFFDIVGKVELTDEELAEIKHKAGQTSFDLREMLSNEDLLKQTIVHLTYNTNTIEGSTMTIDDVATVLDDENVIINKSYREQAEARNHRAAFLFLVGELKSRGRNFTWTSEIILETHKRLMNSLMDDAGCYREYSVRVLGSNVARANYVSIPSKIDELVSYMNEATDDVVGKLAKTHAVFELIHPFGDGNGRVGRLIMFIQAIQYGIVPPLVLKERKRAYYNYLEESNKKEDYRLLEMFVAESILSTDKLLR